MDKDPILVSYERNIPYLNIELYKESSYLYKVAIKAIELSEFWNGFKITKISTATKTGTKIKFKKMEKTEIKSKFNELKEKFKKI